MGGFIVCTGACTGWVYYRNDNKRGEMRLLSPSSRACVYACLRHRKVKVTNCARCGGDRTNTSRGDQLTCCCWLLTTITTATTTTCRRCARHEELLAIRTGNDMRAGWEREELAGGGGELCTGFCARTSHVMIYDHLRCANVARSSVLHDATNLQEDAPTPRAPVLHTLQEWRAGIPQS